MSEPNPNLDSSIFGNLTVPEILHHRLMDIEAVARDNGSELFDFDEDPENGYLLRHFYVTGRTPETADYDPIVTIGHEGKVREIAAYILFSDQYRDAPQLGRDADGRPAEIMRVDPMAELVERTIDVIYYDVDPNPYAEPQAERDTWRVSFDIDAGWSMGFWRKVIPDAPGAREEMGGAEDVETLRLVIEHAERIAAS